MYQLALGNLKTYEMAFSTFIHQYGKVIPIEYTIEAHNDIVKNVSFNVERKHDIISEKTNLQIENFLKQVPMRNIYRDTITHQLGFIEAVERLYDITDALTSEHQRLKIILAEFERIKEHFIWFYEFFINSRIIYFNQILNFKIKIDKIFTYFFKIQNNDVSTCLEVGQVHLEWSEERNYELLAFLGELIEEFSYLKIDILTNLKIKDILFAVGTMDTNLALKTGTVGPIARASNVDQDLRIDDPYWDYLSISNGAFKMAQTFGYYDIYGFVKVLLTEIGVSFEIIQSILIDSWSVQRTNVMNEVDLNQKGQMTVRIETSKGPTLYSIESDGNMVIKGFGFSSPGLANLYSLETRLKNAHINHVARIIHAYNITELALIKS